MGGAGPIPATAIWTALDRFELPDWVGDAIFSIDRAWLATQVRKPQAGE